MLPFCGYNMGDYFGHWLNVGKSADQEKLPKIFHVNWFRKDENGKIPMARVMAKISVCLSGYSNRLTVKEIMKRLQSEEFLSKGALDVTGLDASEKAMEILFEIDKEKFLAEIEDTKEYFAKFGDRLPQGMIDELAKS